LYYNLLSQTRPKPTIVVGIAIINKKSKVLIGFRKSSDQHVKDLHWTFPSGKFNTLNFESEILKTVLRETGLNVRVVSLIHARLIPDTPDKKIRIIGLYYHCRIISGKVVAGGDFKEIKWVQANEVNRFFTTSVADEIMQFLGHL
jgi:ADP-ribose pyrophosphatase YjhB (NUDIX family)